MTRLHKNNCVCLCAKPHVHLTVRWAISACVGVRVGATPSIAIGVRALFTDDEQWRARVVTVYFVDQSALAPQMDSTPATRVSGTLTASITLAFHP